MLILFYFCLYELVLNCIRQSSDCNRRITGTNFWHDNVCLNSFTESQIISELFPFMAYEFSVEARGNQVIHLGTAKCQTSEGG